MNPKLIPTVIVNKNGVTTTVHKKPLGSFIAGTGLPVAPPPPTTGLTEAERSELISQIHDRAGILHEGFSYAIGKPHKDIIRDLMFTYPDNAVTAMHDYLMLDLSHDREEYNNRFGFLTMLTSLMHRDTGNTIHEYLTFKTALPLTAGDPEYGTEIIRGLHSHNQLPVMDNYADSDQDTKRRIAAILSVTESLFTQYKEHQRQVIVAANGNNYPLVMPTPLEFGLPLEEKPEVRLIGNSLIELIIEQPETRRDLTDHHQEASTMASCSGRYSQATSSLRDGLI
jgi:hypothetical protein